MPVKLKFLFLLLGISILGRVGSIATGPEATATDVASIAIQLAMVIGIYRGNETVRKLIVVLSWLGCIGSIILFALTIVPVVDGRTEFIPLLAFIALGLAECIFTIWCLRQDDVLSWIGGRALDRMEAKLDTAG